HAASRARGADDRRPRGARRAPRGGRVPGGGGEPEPPGRGVRDDARARAHARRSDRGGRGGGRARGRRHLRRTPPARARHRPGRDARLLPPRAPPHDPRERPRGPGGSAGTMSARGALALLCGALLGAPAPTVAGPTGLTFVPTTDVVPFHQVNVAVQNNNTTLDGHDAFFRDVQPVPQAEGGLPWRVEGGVRGAPADPPGEYRPMFNLKWRGLDEGYYTPAVAGGVSQLGPGFTPAGFVVLDKTINYEAMQYQKFRAHHRNIRLHGIRVHAGFMQVGTVSRAMLGVDAALTDLFVVWSDWMSGARNDLSLAGVVVVDAHNSFYVALLRQNDESRLSGVVFNFQHTFDW